MGIESTHFPSANNSERIEAKGFVIKLRLAENPDYSYVNLEKDGICFKTVILNETGSVQSAIEITFVPREFEQRARLLQAEIPKILQEQFESVPEGTSLEDQKELNRLGSPGRRRGPDLSDVGPDDLFYSAR